MEQRLRFFKQDNKWYADVPNHTLEENEMVMGADIALDYISDGKDELFVTMTTETPERNALLELKRKDHDDDGAYYMVTGILFMDFMITCQEKLSYIGFPDSMRPEIWICNVTHYVFGEHPEHIYVLKIE